MPTYQYACTACGHQLEAVQAFTDSPLTECPACAGKLRKVFSSVGIVFKGSGFYRNDSRSGGGTESLAAAESKSSESKASESKSSDTTSSTSTTSTESKPAAKSSTTTASSTV